MLCARCSKDNPADASFCEECGANLESACPVCNALVSSGARFCKKCGAELAAARASASPSGSAIRITANAGSASEAPEGERKTVTALFADIKGSTELMRDLDPEEARAMIDPALKLMIDAVHRYDGYVVQSTGDGIFALFGAPVAHEDHPQRAVHAAIAARDDLRRRGKDLQRQGRAGLEVRIGINTGEVVMRAVPTGGHTEYSPVGHVINLASRMQSVAPPDGVVVSEETRRLVEGYFELRSLGLTEVKGFDERINVYEVTGTGTLRGHFDLAARRGLTRFVGREQELELLRRALERATGGRGQLVAVMAEAGTGKSRLVHEFKRLVPQGVRVLEAYSVSHGKASAWLPVLELMRRYFGFEDADDAATRREKVRTALAALDAALDDALPYLLGLLGLAEGVDPLLQMDPEVKRRRTLDAIKRIVVGESLNQPIVLIFEDLHWIDEQTQALLDLLADTVATTKILLLVNYRPEYRHQWTNQSHYLQLGLNPLGRESAEELLGALLGDAVELNPIKQVIVERTGGNPFFIEEIVQGLFDEGALVRDGGGVKVVRSLSQLRLPPTVQGILASRIDRQPSEHKQLLQTLSVIGRESALGLIKLMPFVDEAQLERTLADLEAGEFIYEQPASTGVRYVFKHALTQEVAYNSLLIERRKQLHEHAGQAMESLFAEQLDDHLTQLAHHYGHSDNLDKAVEYLGRAGRQAIQRSAHFDAIKSLNAAIDLIQKLPDSPERTHQELLLQLAVDPALIAVNGWCSPELERAIIRARELCDRLGNPPQLFSVLFGEWVVRFIRAELGAALKVAQQLLQQAESLQNPELLLFAHQALGETLFHMGEFPRAREHHEIALSLDDPERPLAPFGIDEKVVNLSYMSWVLWYLGYSDQALKISNEAVELAQAMSHPDSMGFAYGYAATVRGLRREIDLMREIAERQYAIASEHGLADFLAGAIGMRGWVRAIQGDEEGIAEIEECIASGRITGLKMVRPYYLRNLADACGMAGRFDCGFHALTEALTMAEEGEDRYCEAETYRLKGELLLKQNDSNVEEAENCFRRAIEIARSQSAKSWELRATTSLARLLASQGRRDAARAMLADIYGWFTEGFDTADLIDARALLDQLGE